MADSHLSCDPVSVEDALREAEQTCEMRGARLTRIRRKVLELLLEKSEPAKAYDLLQELDGEGAPKPPTVYRALDFLLQMGLAHKIESLNAYVACGHTGHSHSAVFLICDRCGSASELDSTRTGDLLREETEAQGFELRNAIIEAQGVCAACARR